MTAIPTLEPRGYPVSSYLPLGIFTGIIVWISTLEYGYLLPVGLLGMMYVGWSYRRPLVVLGTIILSQFFILTPSEEITLVEIAYGLYFFGYLAYWFSDTLFFNPRPILRGRIGKYLIAFLVISFVSLGVALAGEASILKWIREYLTLSAMFLFFPLREACADRRVRRGLVALFLVLCFSITVRNLVNYSTAVLAATYAWELLGSRKAASAHFFFAAAIISLSLWMHGQRREIRLLYPALVLLFFLALALTFARGFWAGTLIGIVVLFLLLDRAGKRRLLGYMGVGTVTLVAVVALVAGRFGALILATLAQRFYSTGYALRDVSVTNRLAESDAVLSAIRDSPILGHGFGSTFSFYNILENHTVQTWYVHNAYLFLLFKIGILGAVVFLLFYGAVIHRGWRLVRDDMLPAVERSVIVAYLAIFIGLLLTALTSNIFFEKESLLVIILGSSYIAGIRENTP